MTEGRRTGSTSETHRAGVEFAQLLEPGDVVLLCGQLGAGKTTFTQGVAFGLGVADRVTSPTFIMVREHLCVDHPLIRVLHHADLYRTNSLDEIIDLALGELVEESAVAVIEWGDMAEEIFAACAIWLRLSGLGEFEREFSVSGYPEARRAAFEAWSSS